MTSLRSYICLEPKKRFFQDFSVSVVFSYNPHLMYQSVEQFLRSKKEYAVDIFLNKMAAVGLYKQKPDYRLL